jgi:hypothetical protein
MDMYNIMQNKYIEYINEKLRNGIDLKNITSNDNFRSFRKENLICFRDAQEIDELFFSFSGTCWLSAYNYPKERETINNTFIAKNVGILTFDIY